MTDEINNNITFEEKIELSKKINELLEPIKDDDDDDDDDDVMMTQISSKKEKIENLKKEKEKKILTILGQMFNGVIIPEKLSIRRGEFFRYRCQYPLSLDSVKHSLLENLHNVKDKITNENNLDILEFCINEWNGKGDTDNGKGDTDNGKDTDNSYRYKNNDDDEKTYFRFDDIKIIEKSSGNREEFEIITINGLSIGNNNGNINFYYEDEESTKKDEDEKVRREKVLQTKNFNELYKKFKTKIQEMTKKFIDELNEKIEKREKDLKIIKEKGSHLLISAEIQKGNDDDDIPF